MGLGFVVLIVALVPLATARDLRDAGVSKRTAPDPLLVQIFNDPTATSLTKHHLDDDSDDTLSGSGLWGSSGDDPKPSDDKSISNTVTKGPASGDTATAVELATGQPVLATGGETADADSAAKTQPQTEQTATETTDDSVTDKNAKKPAILPSSSQTVTEQVEESHNTVRDSVAAPKPKSFDDTKVYDAAIVKKTDVPRPDDSTATGKSVVVVQPAEQPAAYMPQADMSATQNDQLPQSQMAQPNMQPQMGLPQQELRQSAMQPEMGLPQQDLPQMGLQPEMPQAPAFPQAQSPGMPDPNALPSRDMAAPAQQLDASQFQAHMPAQPEAAFQPTDAQAQGNMPVYPQPKPYMDPNAGVQVDPSTGLPVAGMQAVPVFQGLKAKKVKIDEDECEDMYTACPDMKRNKYCELYKTLMETQCKKSCGFCKPKDEESGSGSDDEASGDSYSSSGSGSWDEEDESPPIWRKSNIPTASDGESASGSAAVNDVWSSSASGANMIQGEASQETAPTPIAKKDEIAEPAVESGSGQQAAVTDDYEESGSGANLAEDLATGTVSKVSQETKAPVVTTAKYSEIPKPVYAEPRAEVYPRIDLKNIAQAVKAYRHTALRMLGEAIKDAAQEAEDEAAKRTSIPMPPATELLEKMGFPMDEPKSEIPEPQPQMQQPVMAGQQYAYNYQQQPSNVQAFYNVQQDQNVAKSEIEAPPQPEEPEPEPKAEETSADEPKEKEEKKSNINDPFQYLRDMPQGASMQPIEARPGASLTNHGHSNPLILFKNSQISNAVAMKKSGIPTPQTAAVVPIAPQAQQVPATKSGVPRDDINPFNQLAALGGSDDTAPAIADDVAGPQYEDAPAQSEAQAYQQSMPVADNELASPMDDTQGMRSDYQTDLPQSQQDGGDDIGLRELRSYFPGKDKKKKRNVVKKKRSILIKKRSIHKAKRSVLKKTQNVKRKHSIKKRHVKKRSV